jgi:hypothetical protein
MRTSQPVKARLDGVLAPDNCAMTLIDHQPFQAGAIRSIDPWAHPSAEPCRLASMKERTECRALFS